MKHAFQTLVAATAIVSIVGTAGTALADAKADAKCHAAIAKSITKYQGALVKDLVGCHASRSAGKIASNIDCNLHEGANSADIKLKIGAARTKAIAGIAKACIDGTNPAVLALYPRCPSPVKTADDGGATTGIDTFAELGACLTQLSEAYVDRLGDAAMGELTGAAIGKTPEAACQAAVGKAIGKAVPAAGKSRSKCQATVEKGLTTLAYGPACNTGDPDGKVGPAFAAIDTAIDASCGGLTRASFQLMGACGGSAADLKKCITSRVVTPVGNGLVAAAEELPGTCAGRADVVINAAFGHKLTNTRLDSGWTGLAQDVDVVDQSLGGVKLQNCDADCENCDVRLDSTNGYCRCENDPTVKCGTIEGADALCGGSAKCVGGTNEGAACVTGATCNSHVCGAATCHCMFGPPLALSSGGTPVCVVNRFAQEFTGTTQKVGEYSVGTRTRALVHTGLSGIVPCPVCTGDGATINDGIKAGHCSGGPRDGKTCDTNALHPDFGASSFDCPPDPATGISGAGLNLALAFTSGSVSLSAGSIPGADCAAGSCHCSECTGDNLVGCNSDADCIALGAGTCGVNLGTDNPKQNQCTGGVANCVNELCTAGPFDQFCDGYTKKNGDGYLPCSADVDCGVGSLGFDAGACNSTVQRRCFNTTITAQGTPGIFNSQGVSAFCSAATGNAAVNKAGGLPGPGRVKLDFDFNVYCPDGVTKFEEPGGSSCN